MFLQVSVIHSVHRGGCAWFYSGGVRGFIQGGVHGFIRGACMVSFGGMRGFIRGVCVVLFGGACVVLFGGACMVLFGGHMWFYLGGHAWFYSGGGMCGFIQGGIHGFIRGVMHGFIWGGRAWFYLGGACVVFSVFSDTMRYGQWAGGTHPTGMHSCSICNSLVQRETDVFSRAYVYPDPLFSTWVGNSCSEHNYLWRFSNPVWRSLFSPR